VISAMKETCFLHIGTAKTGTTSIQNFMATNRSGLQEQGIIYPRAAGRQSHPALAAYALKDGVSGKKLGRASRFLEAPQFREELRSELDRELRDSDASIIVFSTEQFTSPQLPESAIERAHEFCASYASRTKIIVYLRDQIDFLVSLFGHNIKGGGTRPFPFPLGANMIGIMDYAALLEPWRKTFGRENMIVRRFERADYVDGDLLSDFGAQIPFDTSGFFRSEPRNEGLGARELAFLRAFNARVPRWIDGKKNPARRDLIDALVRFSDSGRRLTVPPEIAQAIVSQFEDSNRHVSEEYFGGKWQPLFPAPQLVSDADVNALLEPTLEDAMDIACRLWSDQELRLQGLEGRPRRRRAINSKTEAIEPATQLSDED
jgi:hypothetical protein